MMRPCNTKWHPLHVQCLQVHQQSGGVVCTHCHHSASCALFRVDVVDVHATHGQLEHAREWFNCQCKEKRREWTSLSHTSFSPEWLRHRLRANDTQCEAPCCGQQSLQNNAIAAHAEQDVFKVVMVHCIVHIYPFQHHDRAICVGFDQAVDQDNVVPDVPGWDECML